MTFKLHYHTLWLDSEILIRYFKKRKKAAIFTVKLMWQFLGRDETISFPIFIVRSLWRSIYHQILQRQVAFHALSKSGKLSCCHCSIILTSFAINLETQYYINCQFANLIHSSLRSKRFQSSYCAKVKAEAKKRLTQLSRRTSRGNACYAG